MQHTQTVGRTRWRRFAAVAIPAGVIAAGLFAGVAAGAVPVMLDVSGQQFKVSADQLDGDGFAQYPGVVVKTDGTQIPVAASAIDSADLSNLCQSVSIPGTPVVLVIRAGRGGTPAHADDLLIGLNELGGDATFTNIDIGKDAGKLGGSAGDFGQRADHVTIDNLRQTAYSTHAGTFKLTGLNLSINLRGQECFATVASP